MSELTLQDVDHDEALTEAIAELYGSTRAEWLRGAALGGAAMLTALSTPAAAEAKVTDLNILNFGLRFERLQANFYTQTDDQGTVARMANAKQRWARTLGAHERAHVRIIKSVLGRKAERSPFFNFGNATETESAFTKTAVAMEDLTVALLTGITPQIHNRKLTAALFGLLTVEARHAAWARHIVGSTPAPDAFDTPKTLHGVRVAVDRTHFVVRRPRRAGTNAPHFTG